MLSVRWGSKFYLSLYRHVFFLALVYEITHGCFDTIGTLRNKHWRMPWSQQFICVECKPWVRGALAMTYSSKVDPDFSCVDLVEADFYASKRSLIASKSFVRDLTFCAICAGTSHDSEGGKVDVVLKTVYMLMCFLFICDTCKTRTAKIVVGLHNHNGKTIQQGLDKQRREKAVVARRE